MNKKLSASLMCADLLNLDKSLKELEKAKIDYIHLDIMDGFFVPNITLGFDIVNAVKSVTDIPLDIHMMVNEPSRFIDRMSLDENDIVCVHFESDNHVHRTLSQIRDKGCKTGLALNPQTPLESMKYLTEYIDMALIMTVSPGFAGQKLFEGAERKTADARRFLDESGYTHVPVEVDGNISIVNGQKLCRSGADIFVLGTSSLFLKDKDISQAAEDFRAALQEVI